MFFTQAINMICILCLYSTGEAGSLSRRIIRAGILVAAKVTSLFIQRGNTALEVPLKITYSFSVLVDRTNRDRQEANLNQPGLGILVSNENFHAPEGSSRYGIQQKLDLRRNQTTQRKVGEKHDHHSINNFPSRISNGCEQISPTGQARQNTSAQVRGDAVGCEGDNTSVSEVHNHTERSDETGLQETENIDVAKVNASTRQNEEDIEMEEISQDEETDDDDDDDDDATIKQQVQEHVPVHIKIDDDRGQEDEHVKNLHESMKIDQATVRQLKLKVVTATKQDCKSSEKGKTALETQEVMVKSIVVSEVMTDSLVSVTSCTKNISECLPGPGPLQSESEAPQVANPRCSQCASGESHDLLHKDNSPTANSKQSPKSTRIDKDLTSTKPRQDKSETALDEKTSGHESQLDSQTEDDSGFFSSQLASMTPPATYLDKDTREHVTPSDADENEVLMQAEMQHLDAKRAEIPIHNDGDLKTYSEDRSNHTARPSPHDEDCEAIYIPNSTLDNFSQTKPDNLINSGSKVVVNDCMCQPGEQQNSTSTKQSTVLTTDGMSTRHPHGATPNSDSEQTHNNPSQGGLLVARSGPQNSDHPQQLCKLIVETETVTTRNIYQVLDMGADRHKDSKGNLCFSYTTTLTTTAEYPNQIITSRDSLFETMAEKHMLHAPFINQSNDAGNSSEKQSGRDDCQNGTRILSTTGDVSFAGEAKTTTDGMVVLYNEMPISDSGSNKSVRTFVSSKLFPQLKQVKLQCTTKEGQLAGHSAAQGRRSIFTECEQHWLSGNNPEEDPTGQRPPTGVVCSEESEDQLDSEWKDRVPAEGETDYANEPTTSKSPNTMLSQELPAGATAFATATTSTEEECGNVNEASNILPEILSTDSLTTMTDVPNKSSETDGVTTNDTNVDGGISHEVLKESQEIGLTVESSDESSPSDNIPTIGASSDTSTNVDAGVQTFEGAADRDEHLGDGASEPDTSYTMPSQNIADVSLTDENKQTNAIYDKSSKKDPSKPSQDTPTHSDSTNLQQTKGEIPSNETHDLGACDVDNQAVDKASKMVAGTEDECSGEVGTDNHTRSTDEIPRECVLTDKFKLPNGADKTPFKDIGNCSNNVCTEYKQGKVGPNINNCDSTGKTPKLPTETQKMSLSEAIQKSKNNPSDKYVDANQSNSQAKEGVVAEKSMSSNDTVNMKTYEPSTKSLPKKTEENRENQQTGLPLNDPMETYKPSTVSSAADRNCAETKTQNEDDTTSNTNMLSRMLAEQNNIACSKGLSNIFCTEQVPGTTLSAPTSAAETDTTLNRGYTTDADTPPRIPDKPKKITRSQDQSTNSLTKQSPGRRDAKGSVNADVSKKPKKTGGNHKEPQKGLPVPSFKKATKLHSPLDEVDENSQPGDNNDKDRWDNSTVTTKGQVKPYKMYQGDSPTDVVVGDHDQPCGDEYIPMPKAASGNCEDFEDSNAGFKQIKRSLQKHESDDKNGQLWGPQKKTQEKPTRFEGEDEHEPKTGGKMKRQFTDRMIEDTNKPFGGVRRKVKPRNKQPALNNTKRNDSESNKYFSKSFPGTSYEPRQTTKHWSNDKEWDIINHSKPELERLAHKRRRLEGCHPSSDIGNLPSRSHR